MYFCICESFSNRMIVALGVFSFHLRTSLGQRKFARRQERLRVGASSAARQHQYARVCPDGRQRDNWRLYRSRNRTKESHYSCDWP